MPETAVILLTIMAWNVLGRRFDYARTWPKRLPRVVARIRKHDPDVAILTECQAAEAKEIAAALGYRWANFLGSSIIYKPTLILGRRWALRWLGSTHGALIIELTRAGQTVNVIANHLPPFAWRAGYRRQCVAKLRDFMAGWSDPVIVGGDFNWPRTLEGFVAGWLSSLRMKAASVVRASYGTSGRFGPGSAIDYLLARKLGLVSYTVQKGTDPATGLPASDHHAIIGQVSYKAVTVPPLATPTGLAAMVAMSDRIAAAKPGYDQGDRWSFYDRASGDVIACAEGDCSSTCGAILKAALPTLDLADPFYTGNYADRAKAAGATVLDFPGLAHVQPGDFLLTPHHHVVFVRDAANWWSAEYDEDGHSTGGKAGLQPGEKVGYRAPYNRAGGWQYVVRVPSAITTN